MNKIIDLHHHLDTLHDLFLLRSKLQDHHYAIEDHIHNEYQTIISLAVYPQPWDKYQDILVKIGKIKTQIDLLGSDVKLITTQNELEAEFKLGILLHIESARIIREPQWQLPQLYELGVRGIIPIHFIDNHLGQSCDDPLRRFGMKTRDEGLTDRGVKFVEILNKLGMWVDVSHTTEQTADDILNCGNEVMASHIAIWDIVKRKRNKGLSFFRKLAEKKGIFGLQPWQHLVGRDEDAYRVHMKVAIEAGLENCLCLGTDLGAPIKTHKSIKSVYDCAEIANQFGDCSELIKYQNAYTFFKRVLP